MINRTRLLIFQGTFLENFSLRSNLVNIGGERNTLALDKWPNGGYDGVCDLHSPSCDTASS